MSKKQAYLQPHSRRSSRSPIVRQWPLANKAETGHPERSTEPSRPHEDSIHETSFPLPDWPRVPAVDASGRSRRASRGSQDPLDCLSLCRSLCPPQGLPQANDAPVGRRAGCRGGGRAGDRRHARPREVRGVPPPGPRSTEGHRRPGPGQHHDLPGAARSPPAPAVAEGGAVDRGPHDRPPLPAAPEGRLCRGGEDVSRLRRPHEQDSRQHAGRVPGALLRFAQYPEPAVLRRDLQQGQPRRPFPVASTRRSSTS